MTKKIDTNFWNRGSLFAVPLIVVMASCAAVIGAHAQGLEGVPEIHCYRSASQLPPLVEGNSDTERWSTFLAVQRSLIGMKLENVEKALGAGKMNAQKSELRFEITQRQGKHKPGDLAAIALSINFDKGIVDSYHVSAVHWAN